MVSRRGAVRLSERTVCKTFQKNRPLASGTAVFDSASNSGQITRHHILQGFEERAVRKQVIERRAGALQNDPGMAHRPEPGSQFVEKPALADAALALQQHRHAAARLHLLADGRYLLEQMVAADKGQRMGLAAWRGAQQRR